MNGTFPLDTGDWNNVDIMLFQRQRRLLETAFNATSFLKARNFFLFFLYSILLYMKKLSNTVNHSNKLMLTSFFCAVFINLYFKTKHLNETFHLGFHSLSNVFSYRKHIISWCNISVLNISGKSRNIKIILPPLPPFYGIVSIFPEGHFIMIPPPILRYFSGPPTPPLLIWSPIPPPYN